MSKKLIITGLLRNRERYLVCALQEGDRIVQVQLQPEGERSLLGNIYLGRVEKVLENIGAAFVEIAPGVPCYLPLAEAEQALRVNQRKGGGVKPGDELLVQVSKEAIKAKVPRLTAHPEFPGKYLVLTLGRGRLGFSSKLEPEEKERIRRVLTEAESFGQDGAVIRTNAGGVPGEEILKELKILKERWASIREAAYHRTCFSLLWEAEPFYLSFLRDVYQQGLEEIVTDLPDIERQVRDYLTLHQPENLEKLRLYEDSLLSLHKLCRLESSLEEALKERVWLKSGGFLVIQQTEALVAIDVNSGKYAGKQQAAQVYKKINLEAAGEIARQLRLRNLSGIILIDFINMDAPEDKKELLEELENWLRRDPIKTQVVDMTALQLVEVTRKKVRKSLEDSLKIKKNML